MFCKKIHTAECSDVAPVLSEYLGGIDPAATMIVCGLVRSEMKIEIEVTAQLSD